MAHDDPAPALKRSRHREWRLLLWCAGVAAALFSLWPGMDLLAASAFYNEQGRFTGHEVAWVRWVYRATPVLSWCAALAALALWLQALVQRRWKGWGPAGLRGGSSQEPLIASQTAWPRLRRRVYGLGLTLLLASGLVVNAGLKEFWGRARPDAVQAFGGNAQFTPALQPARQCATNCSFVSGHASAGFALIGVGVMGTLATRRRWLGLGLLAGGVVGLGRITQGAHFPSDVVFSALFVWASALLIRHLWLRARAARWRRIRLQAASAASAPRTGA